MSAIFQQTGTIFELVQENIGTNLLTKFHEDPTINVASTVLTRQICMTHNERQTIDKSNLRNWTKNVTSRVFTSFHYLHIEKTAPHPGGHVFPPIWTIFELFHDDWAKIVTSRVFTRNTAPPPGGHLHENLASNVTSTVFTIRGINRTNVLTKFHEDRTINVASRVFTRQNVDDARRTTHDGQKVITKANHEHSGATLSAQVKLYVASSGATLSAQVKLYVASAKFTKVKLYVASSGSTLSAKVKLYVASSGATLSAKPSSRQAFSQAQFNQDTLPDWPKLRKLIGTNVLTKLHEDWTGLFQPKTALPLAGHVF
ncbi:hypothetical protein DPMN_029031 [Dreissena polymorpha]|uniref:Uncharacterized protein n=1 Tax=Dreissena polymorpha TaxID=45954 RepID=A0A9D4LYD5_DREPO|nr:hypothetical protein DPMN_029031 [Dreissena polymorpha]